MGCTKATTNNQDIKPLVIVKVLVNILWTARQIHTIELMLESTHQTVFENI